MEKKDYIDNPTGASALSYWKTHNFKNSANIKVLHDNQFNQSYLKHIVMRYISSLCTI
jgi:hypothetical protein